MKKQLVLILVTTLLLSLCACNTVSNNMRFPVKFYYCTDSISYGTPNGVITSEVRDCFPYADDTLALINLYFDGPKTSNCTSPYPSNVRATKLFFSDDVARIYLNDRFSDISGINFTMACACLAKTLMDFYACNTVEINYARAFNDGSTSVTITKDSMLFLDTV